MPPCATCPSPFFENRPIAPLRAGALRYHDKSRQKRIGLTTNHGRGSSRHGETRRTMADPTEIELKLDLDPADHAAIAAALAAEPGVDAHLVSTYFDTPTLALRDNGLTLRVRKTDKGNIQTVKAAGSAAGLFARPEWERGIDGDLPVIDAASGPLASLLQGEPVAERFTSDINRTIWTIARDGATIEIALDRGEVRAGELTASLSELELELKAGSPPVLFALARTLAKSAKLRIGVLSKSERGYDLVEGRQQRAFKAEPILLDRHGTVGEAFGAIAQSCIRQFRRNEALLLESGDADAVHQARVGLRRLRSVFSLFKHLVRDDPIADRLREELKWLAGSLGDIRNLDVLLKRTDGTVHRRLARERAKALKLAKAELTSDRALAIMLDLAEWLAIGDWRDQEAATASIAPVAVSLLDRHRRRLRKRGRHLAKLDDAHRHHVRIEAKKLRYAAEFFASLSRGRKALRRQRDFLEAMETLQDELGLLNDIATAPGIFARYKLGDPPEPKDLGALLKRAEKALETLVEAKRFWR
ncbi:CHAD domain-containing protein [Sphingomonas sp. MMS24-J13]|uniref:CYTH and CHAD domain-containing protein n=1 Tax=Sphingomonas sp. MMS24-J13 TaxID=3238686 RepID=UPI00384F57AB